MVREVGFEPTVFLCARFTVWCHSTVVAALSNFGGKLRSRSSSNFRRSHCLANKSGTYPVNFPNGGT